MILNQSVSFITLGVKNLDTMRKFYKDVFGWSVMKDDEGIVFFRLNGLVLGLFPTEELAEDVGVAAEGTGFKHFTLAMNVESEDKVNEIISYLRNKGVRVVREAERVFWGGYRGYIADPEDNYWEIVYNPFVKLADDGSVSG